MSKHESLSPSLTENQPEVIEVDTLIGDLRGGISYHDNPDLPDIRSVSVCGGSCPDRYEVADQLRSNPGVSVNHDKGCHGQIGGCAMNGVLREGAYATVFQERDGSFQETEVVILKARRPLL